MDSTLSTLAILSRTAAILWSTSLALGGFLPFGLHMMICPSLNHVNSLEILTDCSLRQWVALKVMTSHMSENSRELNFFHALAKKRPDDLSSNYIVKLLDTFVLQGPNGHHKCLVFELLGPTLRSMVKEEYRSRSDVDPPTILKMSEQLLYAVDFIHNNNFAHGGTNKLSTICALVHVSGTS